MNEDVFTKCVTAIICVLILTVGSCTAHRDKVNAGVMASAVEKGISPMEASCGLSAQVTESFCTAIAASRNK